MEPKRHIVGHIEIVEMIVGKRYEITGGFDRSIGTGELIVEIAEFNT